MNIIKTHRLAVALGSFLFAACNASASSSEEVGPTQLALKGGRPSGQSHVHQRSAARQFQRLISGTSPNVAQN
jgi:hypothetical protein